MKKMKKIIMSASLAASLLLTSGAVAFAWSNSVTPREGGRWTYGVEEPGNGYHMGFSYFYHGSRAHRSSVSLDGQLYRSPDTAPRYTSIINAPSSQSTDIHQYYGFV